MAQPIIIPNNSLILPVNLSSSWKTLTLPAVSTNPGRFLILKDVYGNAANSTLRLSTTGLDTIERSNVYSVILSNSYGAWWFTNDGISRWFLADAYLNSFALIASAAAVLPLNPGVRYSFLSANYSGTGNVTNIGFDTSVGAAAVIRQAYTASSPGYITIANQASQYVQAPSQTGIQTIIMIVRVTNAGGNTYMLDARNGLANGWMWNGGTGSDWVGQTYYRDCILTTMPANVPGNLQDSQWHHACFIRPAFTDDVTYLARISQNESVGADCAEIMVFTQALTLQQVKDNFNFFASRFAWTPVS